MVSGWMCPKCGVTITDAQSYENDKLRRACWAAWQFCWDYMIDPTSFPEHGGQKVVDLVRQLEKVLGVDTQAVHPPPLRAKHGGGPHVAYRKKGGADENSDV